MAIGCDKLRGRYSDDDGFTLIELLVVILIIAILSAIAIPAFLSQRSKADDSAAKTQVGTMQTAMETYATENKGSYKEATLVKLEEIEPTLKDKTTAEAQAVGKAEPTEYEISSKAVGTGDTYTLVNKNGTIERTCKVKTKTEPAGCKLTGGTEGTW
jgi:type IV pilus assembly protein PilA